MPTNLKAIRVHGGRVGIPIAPPGKTLETVRVAARRRFFLSSAFLAFGALLLGVAQAFLLVLVPVGGITGLILGALLQILGLGSGAYGAVVFSRAFPLSEPGLSARLALLASLFVVLPVAAGVAAAYALFALPESPPAGPTALVLIPALPFFWGPPATLASIGLVYAARDLASERMAVVAAMGCGAVLATAISSGSGALLDPLRAVESARLPADLLIVAAGFVLIAFAFYGDAWVARSRRAS